MDRDGFTVFTGLSLAAGATQLIVQVHRGVCSRIKISMIVINPMCQAVFMPTIYRHYVFYPDLYSCQGGKKSETRLQWYAQTSSVTCLS